VRSSIGASGPGSGVVPLKGRRDAAAWLSARTALEVVPIRHPVIEALGHHPTSDYAEQTGSEDVSVLGEFLPGGAAAWGCRR
jgi:hypothetical protein